MKRLCVFLLAAAVGLAADAAEVKAFMAEAFRVAINPIAADFETATGHKVTLVYGTAGALRDRLRAGEPADMALLPRSAFDPLVAEGKLVAGTRAPVAQSLISIAARAGAPKPDISTPDALKSALLAARAIGYSDPARGGAIGIHASQVIEKLGLTAQLKDRTRLTSGGSYHELLAEGEIELAFVQPITTLSDPRLELVGPLPPELQNLQDFLYFAAVTSHAAQARAAQEFVTYLASPAAARILKAKGLEPVAKP